MKQVYLTDANANLTSNVMLPGEKKLPGKVNDTDRDRWGGGEIIEEQKVRQTERKRDNSSDWWLMKIKTFLLGDVLSFSLPAVIPFFLSSNHSSRYTRQVHKSVYACGRKTTQTCFFFPAFLTHTYKYVHSSVCSQVILGFKDDLFFSHSLRCLVGKVLENLKEFPLEWLTVLPVMLHYVVLLWAYLTNFP